jgi:hypothetical protein
MLLSPFMLRLRLVSPELRRWPYFQRHWIIASGVPELGTHEAGLCSEVFD